MAATNVILKTAAHFSSHISNEKQRTKGLLKSLASQKQFFDQLAIKYQINQVSDWKKITSKIVLINGGSAILNIYGGSVFNALSSVYPDKEWKLEYFHTPQRYWTNPKKVRKFLDELASKLNIKFYSEWSLITNSAIIKNGGNSLLLAHQGSLFKALKFAYPEWFSKTRKYWLSKENQQKYLENLAVLLKIKKPSEWGSVSVRTLRNNRGSAILKMHGGSLYRTLLSVYPKWFVHLPKYEQSYWQNHENQRQFLTNLAFKFRIKNPEDWKKITASIIHKQGGRALLQKYSQSLQKVLQSIFPETNFNFLTFKTHSKEFLLSSFLETIFQDTEVNQNIALHKIIK